MKQKTCKVCKDKFDPIRFAQVVCSPPKDCVFRYADFKESEKTRKLHCKQRKEFRDNDKPFRAKQAQKAFNAYIRARDNKEPCISCQRHHTGQYHAGHYKTSGGNPELRFEELNCHKQCAPCNNHLSGNIIGYRLNLIHKFGLDLVEWLEGPHQLKKYTASDYKEIETKYKNKLKDLES